MASLYVLYCFAAADAVVVDVIVVVVASIVNIKNNTSTQISLSKCDKFILFKLTVEYKDFSNFVKMYRSKYLISLKSYLQYPKQIIRYF